MKILLGISILFLTACATVPIDTSLARTVPASRVVDPSLLAQNDSDCAITIKRDSGLVGSMCSMRIFFDGNPVADLNSEEKIQLFVPTGGHILSAKLNGVCGGGLAELSILAVSKGKLIFRVGSSQGQDTFIMTTAF